MTGNKIIRQCHAIVRDPVKYLMEQKETHHYKYMGCVCIFAPEELLHAAGFIPVRVLGFAHKLREVEKHLPTNCCEFARNLVETLQTSITDFYDEIFFSHCCDTLQVVGDICKRQSKRPFTIFNAPTNFAGDNAVTYLNDEIRELKRSIETRLGIVIAEDKMKASWDLYQENRNLVQAFYTIRKEKPGVISGYDSMAVLMAGMFMPKEEHNEILKLIIADLQNKESAKKTLKKVVLSGFINGNADLIDLIERSGSIVVDDDLCETSRSQTLAAEAEFHFPDSLSHSILQRFCPVKHNTVIDYSDLVIKKYRESEADMVIIAVFPFCDPQCMEYAILKQKLKQIGIKSLVLEIVVGKKNFAQLETRIEAFLESFR